MLMFYSELIESLGSVFGITGSPSLKLVRDYTEQL